MSKLLSLADYYQPHVKIIVISGLLSNQTKREAANMGVRAFLSKPCTAKELLQAISAIQALNTKL